ncbi:hypothetical protein ACIQCN_09965 [Pseudarthrobacter sp. NPDC092424]|uniref:hypothetical protein n=1 Tax=Pseudarthrobacter sp. NPDC092424 TaxID=3364415 RepID=UPI0038246D3D
MRTSPRTPFHALRAASFNTATVTLAAGAHLAGGGGLPPAGILLAILALTVLSCTVATRLRLGLPAIGALLTGGQLALHEALTLFSATPSAPAVAPPPAGAHAHDTGTLDVPIAALAHVASHVSPADPAAAPVMLAAHALATLGCALLLAQGENALWHLAAWLRPLAELPRAAVVRPGPKAPAVFPSAAGPLRPWRNLRQDSRRGPPSAAVLSA